MKSFHFPTLNFLFQAWMSCQLVFSTTEWVCRGFRLALSNLVAIRHMWRQELWMWWRTVLQKYISIDKYTEFLSIDNKSGDSKSFVDTFVATNVATGIIWLDTADLDLQCKMIFLSHFWSGDTLKRVSFFEAQLW